MINIVVVGAYAAEAIGWNMATYTTIIQKRLEECVKL